MNQTFLQRELEECDRQRWRQELAAPWAEERCGERVKLLVFRAGCEWFGVAPSVVVVAAPMLPFHSIPQRSPALLGVVNLRGTVTLCFSVAEALHCLPGPVGAEPMMLALVCDGWKVGCRVEEVAGVCAFDRNTMTAPPATLACAATQHVLGLFPGEEHSVAWLDHRKLFQTLQEAAR